MAFGHTVYGLRISSNLPIPGLASTELIAVPDLRITFGISPTGILASSPAAEPCWNSSTGDGEENLPLLQVWKVANGSHFHFLYHDGTEFILDRAGTRVWSVWPDGFTLEDACVYLLGPILGFVLRLRGILCLHASAIAVGGDAIALLGPGGTGKSTAAAAFASLGFPVLSDDLAALRDMDGEFCVLPGYPRLYLWPESFSALSAKRQELPHITPNWEKRYLDLTGPGFQFQSEALRLSAIYVLSNRTTDASAPFLETLSAQEGLIQLVGNTHANYLLDSPMRLQEFESLSQLVKRVSLRRVIPADNPSLLPRLCDIILNDFRGLAVSK